jgi:hypothetical protein
MSANVSEEHVASVISYLLHAGFLLGLFFDPENGGDMYLRNVGWLSADYTALFPRRQNSGNNITFQKPHYIYTKCNICSLLVNLWTLTKDVFPFSGLLADSRWLRINASRRPESSVPIIKVAIDLIELWGLRTQQYCIFWKKIFNFGVFQKLVCIYTDFNFFFLWPLPRTLGFVTYPADSFRSP